MGVTYKEIPDGRSSTQDQTWARTYVRNFRAVADSPYIGAGSVRASLVDDAGKPIGLGTPYRVYDQAGTLWEQDLGCFVVKITAVDEGGSDEGDGTQWALAVEYGMYNPAEFPKNPLDHPLKITWGFGKFQKAVMVDSDGKAIVNSAGDFFFDPPVMADDSRPMLRITRNEATFDPVLASQYKDALNSDIFFNQDPKKWKFADITGDLEYNADSGTSDGYYYSVTYELEFNPDTWVESILDQGMRKLAVLGGDPPVQIVDKSGAPVTSPVLLDGSGGVLGKGGTPKSLTFNLYRSVPFAPLDIDPSGAPGQGN